MDLFEINTPVNVLPSQGEAYYYGRVLDFTMATTYLNTLLNTVTWKNDEVVILGKLIVTKRKVAWYADNGLSYTYSGSTKPALPWTTELLELKTVVERKTGTTFNSCLLNLYHNGDEGMGWHSDDEKELGKQSIIASLSLGAERKFSFKNKLSKETWSVLLEHGSLLLMKGSTQTYWLHTLPKTKKVIYPRINLTFRTIL